jgi:hypothetical protein
MRFDIALCPQLRQVTRQARRAARALGAPMAGRHAEPGHPMHIQTAPGAVEGEILELALGVGLHLQELKPEHLRVDGDRMVASTSSHRLVDELVRLRRLLGDGVDGVLEDLRVPGVP